MCDSQLYQDCERWDLPPASLQPQVGAMQARSGRVSGEKLVPSNIFLLSGHFLSITMINYSCL